MNVFCRLRKEKNITQAELAKKLNIRQTTVSSWENGVSVPDYPTLIKLADFFEVSTDFLLGREDDFGIVQPQSAAPSLDKDEQELIANFRELNRLQKQKILAYTEGMLAAERQYTKK